MKKVLIVYATAGIGHKKAAIAVKAALDEIAPKGASVTMIDSLDYTNAFFKWSYLESYLMMVGKLPTLWGLSYYFTDNRVVDLVVSKLRRFNNWLNSFRLVNYIKKTAPDVIISTHFFASEVIADMKGSGKFRGSLVTVITDYRVHAWWVNRPTDVYVVGAESVRSELVKRGIDSATIKVLGIPVEPIFSKKLDTDAVRNKAGLDKDIPVILVMSGGFGVGPIEGITKVLEGLSRPVQAVAICGHNEKLAISLQENSRSFKKVNLKVLGFVNNVYEYMSVADILISKSGGITVSEAMAEELPMVVISPIIGQETANCDFLVGSGAALKIGSLRELSGALESLVDHPEKIESMKEAVRKIKKPMACYDVAKLALGS